MEVNVTPTSREMLLLWARKRGRTSPERKRTLNPSPVNSELFAAREMRCGLTTLRAMRRRVTFSMSCRRVKADGGTHHTGRLRRVASIFDRVVLLRRGCSLRTSAQHFFPRALRGWGTA